MSFFVYILASRRNGTLYIGHTDDLSTRIKQHRDGVFEGFAKRNKAKILVYFETYNSRDEAFRRERRLKEWRRSWKLMLIEGVNPDWRDLTHQLTL